VLNLLGGNPAPPAAILLPMRRGKIGAATQSGVDDPMLVLSSCDSGTGGLLPRLPRHAEPRSGASKAAAGRISSAAAPRMAQTGKTSDAPPNASGGNADQTAI